MLSDGPSVYGYAGQSPLMLYDPTGEGAIGAAIRGAAGGWLGGLAGSAGGPLGAYGGRSLGSRLGARAGDWIGDKWSDNVMCAKPSKRSGKERADDVPSRFKHERPQKKPDGKMESGKEFAERLLGDGDYKRGPGSEFNQLKKFGDRGFK